MQDSKYKYMFPPEKGQPYPENFELLSTRYPSSWAKPFGVDVGKPCDGSFLRDCWLMRVPLIKWVETLEPVHNNTCWVSYGDDGYPKYTIIQALRENKIVFYTCSRKYFDTLDEAKNSY
jgi:hypothetical protein